MILPLKMSSTGYMFKNWLTWKESFLEFMEWQSYNKESEEFKITTLRNMIGCDALRDQSVSHILNLRNIQRFATLYGVLERLDIFFSSMKNELIERYQFFNRFQGKNEPFETYILDLSEKAKTCNFGTQCDSLIRDKVIANLHNKELRIELFQTLNLDLAKLLQICKAHEAKNKNNNGKIVEERRTQTDTLYRNNIVLVDASNGNNKKDAEGKQNSNKKVNANINVKTWKGSISDKTKTGSKNDNSGNNTIGTTNRRHNDTSNKAETDSKIDSNDNSIIDTTNQRHSDISNKAKTDSKIDNSGNNIIGTNSQRYNYVSNKADIDSNTDNSSSSNIIGTACRENNTNISEKTKINSKNGNNVSNHIDLACRGNTNDINDKAKIDSKGVNSNHNMNIARRNSDPSGTQYRRNCGRCNEKHAERCCPAWGYKCEKCGERNHFSNCCKMIPLKTEEHHINMSSKENVLNPNYFQHNQQDQPKSIPPNNYNLVANIEPFHNPSAPVFFETENELYPMLWHMQPFQETVPQNTQATIGNTEPEVAVTEIQKDRKCSNSEKADTCSVS